MTYYGYPYLIVRSSPGGCRRVPVVFTDVGAWSGREAFAVPWVGPQRDGAGDLTAGCRAALVEAVKALVRETGEAVLVCLGRREWVSVEGPDCVVWNHREPSWLSHGADLEKRWGKLPMEESEERSDGGWGREFPFIVLKGGAPVCGFNQIEILQVEPGTPPTPGVFTLIYPGDSTDDTGRLTEGCRAALVEAVRRRVERTGLRMCVVFGVGDAVYVEPAGSGVHSASRPGWRGRGTSGQQVEDVVVVESHLVH